MAYDYTGLDNPGQINVGFAGDNSGIGFKLELGWMWVILGVIASVALALYRHFS